MTPERFVSVVAEVVRDGAANCVLANVAQPPGRGPKRDLVAASEWFDRLGDQDRDFVARLCRETADAATFQFLCVLDGVVAIEEAGEKGTLVLQYVAPDGETRVLNDEQDEFLHDLLRRTE